MVCLLQVAPAAGASAALAVPRDLFVACQACHSRISVPKVTMTISSHLRCLNGRTAAGAAREDQKMRVTCFAGAGEILVSARNASTRSCMRVQTDHYLKSCTHGLHFDYPKQPHAGLLLQLSHQPTRACAHHSCESAKPKRANCPARKP